MKIGLLTAGLGRAAHPRTLRTIAERAERLGFGTLWAPEHVVLFDRYTQSKYPYSADGAATRRSGPAVDGSADGCPSAAVTPREWP
jgi:alkanesulfonate monooxygenase SsuD/methylene tetrahydromethanopterin reductase-like flavin-dependent oxidoreductase (luciferase family)